MRHAGTAGATSGGYFNNQWWQNDDLTFKMHCLRVTNIFTLEKAGAEILDVIVASNMLEVQLSECNK